MDSLIEQLTREAVLVCPGCRRDALQFSQERLLCIRCSAVWPVRNGVPDLFGRYREAPTANLAELTSEQVGLAAAAVDILNLATDDETLTRVAEIVQRASSWSCDSEGLTAEINQLQGRFESERCEMELPAIPERANLDPRIRFERHYLPGELVEGSGISANFRVTNVGRHAWSSRGQRGLVLAGSWLDRDSMPLGAEVVQTRFPIDVPSGRSISVPMRIQVPQRPGRHCFRVYLAWEDGSKAAREHLDVPTRVGRSTRGWLRRRFSTRPARLREVDYRPIALGYAEDHKVGRGIVEAALKKLGDSGARILEVGCGVHPQLAWSGGCQVVGTDISSPLLELGSLHFGKPFLRRLAFVCADACNPPLRTRELRCHRDVQYAAPLSGAGCPTRAVERTAEAVGTAGGHVRAPG